MTTSVLFAADALSKSFGGLCAVDGLTFSVARGEIVGLLGPNGSGKTTALNLISGALAADAGSIRLDGADISRLPAHRRARAGIARTFQLVRVLGSLTIAENVIAALAFRAHPLWGEAARARAGELLDLVGLGGRIDRLAKDLAYIDQKRLELARALALDGKLLLLDEWLAGLNPTELNAAIGIIQRLQSGAIGVVMVEHVMDAIRALCGRCVVMNAGKKIAEGAPADVLADPDVIRAYLGDADA